MTHHTGTYRYSLNDSNRRVENFKCLSVNLDNYRTTIIKSENTVLNKRTHPLHPSLFNIYTSNTGTVHEMTPSVSSASTVLLSDSDSPRGTTARGRGGRVGGGREGRGVLIVYLYFQMNISGPGQTIGSVAGFSGSRINMN